MDTIQTERAVKRLQPLIHNHKRQERSESVGGQTTALHFFHFFIKKRLTRVCYLSIHIFVCLSLSLSLYLPLCVSLCLSVCICVYLSLSVCLSVSVCLSLCNYLSIYPSIHSSTPLSVSLYFALGTWREVDAGQRLKMRRCTISD